ncbi:MAG: hypothetical protein AB1656_16265 [Candidatus Omnitrophota bacterium]
MKPHQEKWNLVINGYWNRMIFMPEWVCKNLFVSNEVEKLVPIAPVAPLIYRDKESAIHIDDRKLFVDILNPSDQCIIKAEKMVCTVLEELPNTPINGLGINFGFKEKTPSKELLEIFDFKDNSCINLFGGTIKSHKIIREIIINNKMLNLYLINNIPGIDIMANFHHSITTAREAIENLRDKTLDLYEMLLKFLENVYGLRMEREN